MTFAFGQPVDPRYTRYVDGMQEHSQGNDSPGRWRWHPLDGVWYSYPIENYILEDVGLSPTQTPATFSWMPSGAQLSPMFKYENFALEQAFGDIDAAYQGFKGRFPHAVWSARGGDWRAPSQRTGGPGPGSEQDLPANAKSRIALVRKAVSDGYITPDQAAGLIRDIVAEYT